MLAGFKLEIAKMRSEGATQAEIDRMLDEFEVVHPLTKRSCLSAPRNSPPPPLSHGQKVPSPEGGDELMPQRANL